MILIVIGVIALGVGLLLAALKMAKMSKTYARDKKTGYIYQVTLIEDSGVYMWIWDKKNQKDIRVEAKKYDIL